MKFIYILFKNIYIFCQTSLKNHEQNYAMYKKMQPKLNKYWLPSIEACVKIKPKCAKTFKIRMKIDTENIDIYWDVLAFLKPIMVDYVIVLHSCASAPVQVC